jgi:sugar O-acyltransferase (sialic acid O-acetyltransferase NeuD family)
MERAVPPVDRTRPVAIFGGRGDGAAAAFTLARAADPHPSPFAGFLNDVEAPGSMIEGARVLGPFAHWSTLNPLTRFLAPLHKAKEMERRSGLIRALGVPEERWTNIVDPTAIIAAGTLIGSGIWAQAGSMVMPGARVGSHVALRSNSHVSHDAVVEDFVHIGLGAIVCGYCTVRRGAYLAPGAIVRDFVTVGRNSVVGLGAVVLKDVPDGAIVFGNPARIAGRIEDGGD